ncbi:hypothetical protein NFI96_014802, partial [Prochilodus magdalenae]
MFWSNRGGRIKAFPKLSESGNFSILLRNVQRPDLGLYRCELYEGTNCSIAYQELHLTESKCRRELTGSINITTELQSDVLLPCIFEPTLLGSDRTADVAAVWSQRDITVDNLVEIKLQGGEMFWSNRGGRIKAFPKLSEPGDFSILLRNVQRSDLGLYRCELYEGIGCSIAYQELHLKVTEIKPAVGSSFLIRFTLQPRKAHACVYIFTLSCGVLNMDLPLVLCACFDPGLLYLQSVSNHMLLKTLPIRSAKFGFKPSITITPVSTLPPFPCLYNGEPELQCEVKAESKCRSELTSSINVTTELQSDVLLPCIFEPTLLGSDRTADVAAVWSQMHATVDNLVEINLQGGEKFWNNRGGRIKAFPKLSESGNFSILLRNVQRSDLGLYRCELHEGINCSIAYQELHLGHKQAHGAVSQPEPSDCVKEEETQSESKCRSELTSSINVTTELQSDVLLPCIFEPTLLGSDRTADVAAVWSQRNVTVDNLLEINLQGVVMVWNIRGGRIKAFPKLSESGNFSILLHNVQLSDLGLYRCELYEGIDCSIAYQELHL